MEQINTYALYSLGSLLRDCFAHARLPVKLWINSARQTKATLDGLSQPNATLKFDESSVAASELSRRLGAIIEAHDIDDITGDGSNPEGVKLTDQEVAQFNSAAWTFDQALALELGRAPIFYVTAKGIYDTRRLIQAAEAVYEGYGHRLPQAAIDDTREAGRCLAFTLPTAAGFHISRATEAVIKEYMRSLGCSGPRDRQRNWGRYIEALKAKKSNEKIIHHLEQLKDLHRNPISHPDATLTMTEALALWALCVSVIQAMTA